MVGISVRRPRRYLIREENGLMIAVCTHHCEKTVSTYYSHVASPRMSFDQIHPVDHPYDPSRSVQAVIAMVLRPSLVRIDCRKKTAEESSM